MGKKKDKKKLTLIKPWCYYCDRTFDDDSVLIEHQRAKHFKCGVCKKRMMSPSGLKTHLQGVHKENTCNIANAIAGREQIEYNIVGMDGIPDHVYKAHVAKVAGVEEEDVDASSAKRAKVEEEIAASPPAVGVMIGGTPTFAPPFPHPYPNPSFNGYPMNPMHPMGGNAFNGQFNQYSNPSQGGPMFGHPPFRPPMLMNQPSFPMGPHMGAFHHGAPPPSFGARPPMHMDMPGHPETWSNAGPYPGMNPMFRPLQHPSITFPGPPRPPSSLPLPPSTPQPPPVKDDEGSRTSRIIYDDALVSTEEKRLVAWKQRRTSMQSPSSSHIIWTRLHVLLSDIDTQLAAIDGIL